MSLTRVVWMNVIWSSVRPSVHPATVTGATNPAILSSAPGVAPDLIAGMPRNSKRVRHAAFFLYKGDLVSIIADLQLSGPANTSLRNSCPTA